MKVWNKEAIVELLMTNDRAVVRAIKVLYARQTADEQRAEQTKHVNGVGFNGPDAAFLSSIAKALPRYNDRMTPKQIAKARKMLPKYHRQLLEEIQSRQSQQGLDPAPAASPVRATWGAF
jgi:hypothetical protein